MSEWKEIRLRDVCTDISYGYTASATDRNTGYKFLRITDIVNSPFSWDSVPYCEINEKDSIKYRLSPGDIVIARTGATTGTTYTVKDETNAVYASYLIKYQIDRTQADPFFIGYCLRSENWKGYVENIIGGSAQPGANAQQFADYEILLPTIPEQQSIAEVLSSLDDKIDLLHRQNKTLEQMAEIFFRQWFVEEENKQIILKDAIKTTSGGTPSRANSTYYNGTIPWVKSKELNNNFILTTEEHITEEGLNKSSAKLLKPFTVMIAMYGATVGEIGIIEKSATCNQAICAIEQTNEYPYTFLDQFFKSIKTDLINLAVGGAQQNISQDLIKALEIPAPSAKIFKYNEIVSPFYNKLLENVKQIQKLTELRNLLLPKLMNGTVRVFNN